jgi:Methyltransferase domain
MSTQTPPAQSGALIQNDGRLAHPSPRRDAFAQAGPSPNLGAGFPTNHAANRPLGGLPQPDTETAVRLEQAAQKKRKQAPKTGFWGSGFWQVLKVGLPIGLGVLMPGVGFLASTAIIGGLMGAMSLVETLGSKGTVDKDDAVNIGVDFAAGFLSGGLSRLPVFQGAKTLLSGAIKGIFGGTLSGAATGAASRAAKDTINEDGQIDKDLLLQETLLGAAGGALFGGIFSGLAGGLAQRAARQTLPPKTLIPNVVKPVGVQAVAKPDMTQAADFDAVLARNGIDQLKMTCFFRRGPSTGMSANEVADALLQTVKPGQKLKILVPGIANGEEPVSLLAMLRTQGHKLDDIDLHMMDLQPSSRFLLTRSMGLAPNGSPVRPPEYGTVGFVPGKNGFYELDDATTHYMQRCLANPKKTEWETPVQVGLAKHADNTYDVVSCNNTLYYIDDMIARDQAHVDLVRILKPGGLLVTDVGTPNCELRELLARGVLVKLYGGIYQKVA